MAITVVTAAEETNLTTREAVQVELPDATDAVLDQLIPQVSAAIETYCGRTFGRAEYTETLPGFGSTVLMLSRVPIASVSEVTHRGEAITDYIIEDARAGFLYRERGWSWTVGVGWNLASFPIPGTELPLYSVTYEAGWYLPGNEDRDLPYDLEKAAIEAVKAWYLRRRRDPDLKSKRVGELSLGYGSGASNLPATILNTLEQYKAVV